MKTYSIYETKARLSQLLRLVRSGLEIVVTDRGHPVAKLVPYQAPETLENRLAELEKTGHLKPSSKPFTQVTLGRKKGALKRFLESRD